MLCNVKSVRVIESEKGEKEKEKEERRRRRLEGVFWLQRIYPFDTRTFVSSSRKEIYTNLTGYDLFSLFLETL